MADLNIPSNLFPTSYSGSSPWVEDWAKNLTGQYGDNWMSSLWDTRNMFGNQISQAGAGLTDAFKQLSQLPSQIEAARVSMPQQFLAGLKPMQEYYQPALENMNKRGILNSSITGDALKGIQNDINRQYAEQLAGANTWAAQQNLATTQMMPSLYAGVMDAFGNAQQSQAAIDQAGASLLANIAGLGRYSESENPWAPWASMIPYLMG